MAESNKLQSVQNTMDELVTALEQATDLLEVEFLNTEGSGYETLLKCKKALAKAAAQEH